MKLDDTFKAAMKKTILNIGIKNDMKTLQKICYECGSINDMVILCINNLPLFSVENENQHDMLMWMELSKFISDISGIKIRQNSWYSDLLTFITQYLNGDVTVSFSVSYSGHSDGKWAINSYQLDDAFYSVDKILSAEVLWEVAENNITIQERSDFGKTKKNKLM